MDEHEVKMQPQELLEFLGVIEKLKCNTRHSWTSSGRKESIAEHSWRLAVIAMLLKDEFDDTDNNKLIKMCLVHDFGEAITGDIPCFNKNKSDEKHEDCEVDKLISTLPEKQRLELSQLFIEMREMKTTEAKLVKALDKLEAVISHNEADISTWIPLEYELNVVYGKDECKDFEYLVKLRKLLKDISLKKIEDKNNNQL